MISLSIIMTVYDQASDIESNLPSVLTQDYGGDYQVIVVDETSTDSTEDVLKLLKDAHPRLYTTFLPKPNRQVVRKKLAFSIGVKAAKYEWVMFTNVRRNPLEENVVSAIAEAIDETSPLTLGYFGKKGIRLQSFEEISQAQAHIRKSERKLKKIHERKKMNYLWGRYDFVITRKELAYDVLQYYEQKISWTTLFGLRMKIFFYNLFCR
ncbi:MAG: glycosyltransferase [Prevotella sp.]|nr:glycosyltransferase [Prevotella sp.]